MGTGVETPPNPFQIAQEIPAMAQAHFDSYRDVHIDRSNPDTSYGTVGLLNLERKNLKHQRILLEFDVSSIPYNAAIEQAVLRMYLKVPGKTSPIPNVLGDEPPDIPFSVAGGRQVWPFELRFLTQRFQNSATWNRYQSDRATYSSSTSSSYFQFSSSGTWVNPSSSSGGQPGTHEWPAGAGAIGDTISDGEVQGNLPVASGWHTIACRDLVTYGIWNNSGIVGLLMAKISSGNGIWQYVASENYAISSSSSSEVASLLQPELRVWWHSAASSGDSGSTG